MIIQSTQVWTDEGFRPCQLKIENGTIQSIETYGTEACDIDFSNLRVVPGF